MREGTARGGLIAVLPSGRAPAPLPALAAGSSGLEAPRKGSAPALSDASWTLCPPRFVPWGFAASRPYAARGGAAEHRGGGSAASVAAGESEPRGFGRDGRAPCRSLGGSVSGRGRNVS